MDTLAGVKVGMDGCARRSNIARATHHQKINGYQKNSKISPNASPGQIEKILFDFDRAELKPQYYSALDEAAEMLSRSPLVQVEIHGHTDNVGAFDYNLTLSQSRAAAVVDALVSKNGIAASRLVPFGAGPTAPVASNATEQGRAKNRRVELVAQ